MKTYVVLLRGVTPSGKNKVLMAPLRVALTEAGLRDARTYIQSGNVIMGSNLSQARLERLVHDVIQETFGGDIAVMARTAEQFAGIVTRNPFARADTSRVYFYSDSKLSNNFIERRLRVAATTRNINTMTRLAELSRA